MARFVTINSNFEAQKEHPLAFYDRPLETLAAPRAASQQPDDFFELNRPDTLSVQEARTLMVLDSVRKLPAVRSLLEVADVVVNGYYRVGKFDVGPVLATIGYNNIEGLRPRIGFRTTPEISRDWTVRAYLAYGVRDGRFTSAAPAPLTSSTAAPGPPGLRVPPRPRPGGPARQRLCAGKPHSLRPRPASATSITAEPVLRDLPALSLQSDLFRGFTQKVTFRHQQFRPLYRFAYYTGDVRVGAPTDDQFSLSEIVLESRYAPDKVLVQNENQNRRTSFGLKRLPITTLRYTLGLNRFLGGDFRYHKLNLLVAQSVRLGQLGRSTYTLDAGYIPSTVPYPVLQCSPRQPVAVLQRRGLQSDALLRVRERPVRGPAPRPPLRGFSAELGAGAQRAELAPGSYRQRADGGSPRH